MSDPHGYLKGLAESSGLRKIVSLDDLPPDKVMLAYIREAVDLNKSGIKEEKPKKVPRKEVEVPKDLLAALKKNKKALATFEAFSPSHKREYVEWITEAKKEETRVKRVTTAIEWLNEGKSRHWKYQNC
jgi:uncharacterized protein YdeI (YjbR/CyaY-like superfamily)